MERISHSPVLNIYQLVQAFLLMVRKLQGEKLDTWLTKVTANQISEPQRFTNGIEPDKAAVLVAICQNGWLFRAFDTLLKQAFSCAVANVSSWVTPLKLPRYVRKSGRRSSFICSGASQMHGSLLVNPVG